MSSDINLPNRPRQSRPGDLPMRRGPQINDDSDAFYRGVLDSGNMKLVIDQQSAAPTTTAKSSLTQQAVNYLGEEREVAFVGGSNRVPVQVRSGKSAVPLMAGNNNGLEVGVTENSGKVNAANNDHHHHEGHKPTTKIATFANLIKGNIGTGILSLPFAMKNAGVIVGTAGLVLVGFLCTYCMHQLLIVYRKVLRTRPGVMMDYADVAEAVFEDAPSARLRALKKTARHTINFFLVFTQVGICCVYLNFCPTMVKEVVDSYTREEKHVSLVIYQAITTALLIPYCFVRTLHVLAIFSLIANLLTMASLCVVMQYVFRNLQVVDNLPLVTNGSQFFMYFGSVMFAYESITFVLPFESKMKDRASFHGWNGLMSFAMVVIIVIYTTVAFYGYLAFGDDSKLILRNMPDHWVYHSVRLIYATCIFLSFNLQLFIPIQIVWPPLRKKIAHIRILRDYGEYFLRTFIVLLTFGLAAGVPCLELMISLVGSLAISSLALVFPPILEMVCFMPGAGRSQSPIDTKLDRFDQFGVLGKPSIGTAKTADQKGTTRELFADEEEEVGKCGFGLIMARGIVIIFIGIAASIVGTYVVIVEIVDALRKGSC